MLKAESIGEKKGYDLIRGCYQTAKLITKITTLINVYWTRTGGKKARFKTDEETQGNKCGGSYHRCVWYHPSDNYIFPQPDSRSVSLCSTRGLELRDQVHRSSIRPPVVNLPHVPSKVTLHSPGRLSTPASQSSKFVHSSSVSPEQTGAVSRSALKPPRSRIQSAFRTLGALS